MKGTTPEVEELVAEADDKVLAAACAAEEVAIVLKAELEVGADLKAKLKKGLLEGAKLGHFGAPF